MSDVLIRPVRMSDVDDLVEVRTRPNVLWGTLQLPTLTREEVERQTRPSPGNYSFVAEVGGKVVGQVGLHQDAGPRMRHSAGIGMSIHDDFQGRGIGRRLINAILELADHYLMLERVHLEVWPDNERAVRLYETSGFVAAGIERCGALRDGKYVDMLHMVRLRGRAAIEPAEPAAPAPFAVSPGRAGPCPEDLVVRGVHSRDAADIHRFRIQPGALWDMGRLPTYTLMEVEDELKSDPIGGYMMVAETGGQVVGLASMRQFQKRRAHVAHIGAVLVSPDWWGRGIGERLAQSLVDLGDNWLGLKRLELTVSADNHRAIALYKKLGFETELLHKAYMMRGGRFSDMYLMARVRV